MIYLLGGPIGSGKSLFAMRWMYDAVKSGRPVYTNITLKEVCPFQDQVGLIGTDEFPVALEKPRKNGFNYFWEYVEDDSLIILDEADIDFDSSDYGEMKRETKVYYKQSRKFGHDVVCIVQRFSNLYKRIRDLGSRFVVCEHNFRTVRFFQTLTELFGRQFALRRSRFLRREYPWHDCKPNQLCGEGFIPYKEAMTYFDWYDTKQLLGDTETLLKRRAFGGAGKAAQDKIADFLEKDQYGTADTGPTGEISFGQQEPPRDGGGGALPSTKQMEEVADHWGLGSGSMDGLRALRDDAERERSGGTGGGGEAGGGTAAGGEAGSPQADRPRDDDRASGVPAPCPA